MDVFTRGQDAVNQFGIVSLPLQLFPETGAMSFPFDIVHDSCRPLISVLYMFREPRFRRLVTHRCLIIFCHATSQSYQVHPRSVG